MNELLSYKQINNMLLKVQYLIDNNLLDLEQAEDLLEYSEKLVHKIESEKDNIFDYDKISTCAVYIQTLLEIKTSSLLEFNYQTNNCHQFFD